MSVPCIRCRGASHPATGHLTGLTEPLCWGCANAIVAFREELADRLTEQLSVLTLEYLINQEVRHAPLTPTSPLEPNQSIRQPITS